VSEKRGEKIICRAEMEQDQMVKDQQQEEAEDEVEVLKEVLA
jgi:hypothetical protein